MIEDEYFYIYVHNVVDKPKFRRNEENAKKVVGQILKTAGYFHKERVVHGHLSIEHYAQVNDFWKESVMNENYEMMQPDMPPYYTCPSKFTKICAPEIMKRQHYDKRADFWSIGFILWKFIEDPKIVE